MVAVLLAEQRNCTKFLSLLNGDIAVIGQRNILANACVHNALNLLNLLIGHLLEMREIETDAIGGNQRTLLLNMCTEYLTQCLVEQVSARVVCRTSSTLCFVNLSNKLCRRVSWQLLCYMYWKVILLLCVNNLNALVATYKITGITYLTTTLCIERSLLEYNLIVCLVLLLCLAVTED